MAQGRKEPSALFGFRSRQRILVALAHLGPLRLQEVLDIAGCEWDAIVAFARDGIVAMYGNDRARMLALNPRIPAFKEFKALLRAIEPSPREKRRLPPLKGEMARCDMKTDSLRDLFGGWRLTATVVTVALYGGTIKVLDVRRALRFQRANSVDVTRALQILAERGIISVEKDCVMFRSDFPATQQVIVYAEALAKKLPEYDLRDDAKQWERPISATTPRGLIDWKRDDGNAERPAGVAPSNDGTPLLFGTVSRFRALTTLAVNGSMRPADLIAATKMNKSTYRGLMDDGWLET